MINYDLSRIKGMAFDIDGVLSDSVLVLTGGNPIRTAHVKDGYVLQLAAKMGFQLAIITGGQGKPTEERYRKLGFQDIFTSCQRKEVTLNEWLAKYDLKPEDVLYIGDDIPDYLIMKQVGCSCCPHDAATEIKEIATYISPFPGGHGCVRDVVEQVLRAQGKWLSSEDTFGW